MSWATQKIDIEQMRGNWQENTGLFPDLDQPFDAEATFRYWQDRKVRFALAILQLWALIPSDADSVRALQELNEGNDGIAQHAAARLYLLNEPQMRPVLDEAVRARFGEAQSPAREHCLLAFYDGRWHRGER